MSFGQYSNQSYMPRTMREAPKDRASGKRVKGSFTTRQTIHVWAQRSQTYGQNGKGNVFFRGDMLFDYGEHFCLGQFVQNKRGELACLLNANSHSVTTTHHQSVTRGAIPHGIPTFTIPGAGYNRGEQVSIDDILQSYAERAAEIAGKARRARANKEWLQERATELALEAARYAQFFNLKNAPHDLASLEQAAARIAAKRERAEKAKDRERRKQSIANFEAWQNGTGDYCPREWAHDDEGGVRIRINGDTLQTALGAEVPLSHAIRAFRFIKRVRERGKAWEKNSHSVRVGHFTVDKIEASGNVRAGCHTLSWQSIEAMARVAGVFEQPASEDALEAKGA